MNKSDEFFKKDNLIKIYSNKPFPKFIKYLGWIKKFDEYEIWKTEYTKVIIKWIGTYLVVLPFFICLAAWSIKTTPNVLKEFFLAEGISISWYLLISLIKDIRGAIKNG